MNRPGELKHAAARTCERGGARLNFLLVMGVIVALIYVGAQYVPAAYHAWAFERFMQDTLDTAVSTGKTTAWVEQQLRHNFEDHRVPEDAAVEVKQDRGRMSASVRYTLPISLLVTEYEYDFDVSARSVAISGGGP